jgi:hypothetical protein
MQGRSSDPVRFPSDQSTWTPTPGLKILGMKPWQAGFLVIAGCLDCSVLAVGGWFALGLGGSPAAVPAASPTPAPLTQTLAAETTPTDTLAAFYPTYTPSPEGPVDTATLAPTQDPFAGWIKFENGQIDFMLPDTFAGGDPRHDAPAIMDSLRAKGANFDFDTLTQILTTAPKEAVFWAIDSHQGNPHVVTNLGIIADKSIGDEPLRDYATRVLGGLAADYNMVSERTIINPSYEIQQEIMGPKDSSASEMQLILYSIKDGDLVWVFLFFTGRDEMGDRLPMFDKIVSTFHVKE